MMAKRVRAGLIAVCAAGALFSGTAQAQTSTSDFQVSAIVLQTCTVTASNLEFGTYQATSTSNGTSTVTVTCTSGTDATIDISAGSSGDNTARAMVGGSDGLAYDLYTDAGRTQPLIQQLAILDGAVEVYPVDLTIYGQIPANQFVRAGSYTDLLTATITY